MKDKGKILFNDWEILPAAQYCSRVADGTHDTPKPLDAGKKLITSKHLKDGRIDSNEAYFISESDFVLINRRSKVDKWDVLFSMIGTVGEIVLVQDEPDFAIKNIGLFKNKTETNGRWLSYFLSSKIGQAIIDTYSTGSSQRFVALGDLRKLPILNPPDEHKSTIIKILKSYDDLIEVNNKRISLLEQMAEQIYKEWFVRMRFPGYENTKFEKGVPKGWEVKKLSQILSLSYGKSLLEDKRDGGIYPVYGSSGVIGSHSKFLVAGPGIIVGRKGNVGSVFFSYTNFYPIDTVYYVASKLSTFYLFHLLKTIHFIDGDAAVPGLNREQVYSSKIFFPGFESIEKFHTVVSPIFEQKRNIQEQVKILKQSRDLLLSRLISGQLRVKDIEAPQSI